MGEIVVGVDESEGAAQALRWAASEGEVHGWTVTAVILLVVGARGMGGFKGLLLGSVSQSGTRDRSARGRRCRLARAGALPTHHTPTNRRGTRLPGRARHRLDFTVDGAGRCWLLLAVACGVVAGYLLTRPCS